MIPKGKSVNKKRTSRVFANVPSGITFDMGVRDPDTWMRVEVVEGGISFDKFGSVVLTHEHAMLLAAKLVALADGPARRERAAERRGGVR